MNRLLLLIAATAIILVSGCSGINELAKFDLTGKTVYFASYVSNNASRIQITTEDPKDKKEDKSVVDILASIGSDILSESSKDDLQNSVDTEELSFYISGQLEKALKTYLTVQPVELENKPDYIVESTLEDCQLVVKESGVSVYVSAVGRIIERATGKLVWENSESKTIPIEENSVDKNSSKSLVKVVSALQLASLDEEELNEVVGTAAGNVGAYMAETFREDLAESKE